MPSDKGQRVLVTGAAGMIGANLVRRLLAEGNRVSVMVRPESGRARLQEIEDRLDQLPGDMTDEAAVRSIVRSAQPQIVFHLASTIWARTPATAARHLDVNVSGTLRLLEALREFPEARFVFTGSSAAYGPGSGLRETDPLRPNTIYGATKASASVLVQTYARVHGLRTVELRLFMPYGPWEYPSRLIPHAILSALAKRDVLMTKGDQQRDLVYMDDVVDALLLAATRPVTPGSVFNIGSGAGIPVRKIVEQVLELMGNPVRALLGMVPMRPDEMMESSAEITAAREQLGWQPRVPLMEGLRRSIDWFTAHASLADQLSGEPTPVATGK